MPDNNPYEQRLHRLLDRTRQKPRWIPPRPALATADPKHLAVKPKPVPAAVLPRKEISMPQLTARSLKIGDRFGYWTALGEAPKRGGRRRVLVRCDCGTEKEVELYSLVYGGTKSCGCFRHVRGRKHGMGGRINGRRHPLYQCWQSMRQRCSNPNRIGFANWGGRGIRVCQRWDHSFEAFLKDMGPSWRPGLQLDRIDNNGDYEPSNCRWTTPHQQHRNYRRNRMIDAPFGRMCLKDAAKHIGISLPGLQRRLREGWPPALLFGIAQPGRSLRSRLPRE